MRFCDDDEVRSYLERELERLVRNRPEHAWHVRPHWRYSDLAAHDLDVGHLVWKIYRSDVRRGEVWEYYTLEVSSDRRLFLITFGNSDVGVSAPEDEVRARAFVVRAEDLDAASLGACLERVLDTCPMNAYSHS
jgi:hypothetical protein